MDEDIIFSLLGMIISIIMATAIFAIVLSSEITFESYKSRITFEPYKTETKTGLFLHVYGNVQGVKNFSYEKLCESENSCSFPLGDIFPKGEGVEPDEDEYFEIRIYNKTVSVITQSIFIPDDCKTPEECERKYEVSGFTYIEEHSFERECNKAIKKCNITPPLSGEWKCRLDKNKAKIFCSKKRIPILICNGTPKECEKRYK